VAASGLPDEIKAVMNKPQYKGATWSLLVSDLRTGEKFYPLNPGQLSFTGSTRKLFSIGEAMNLFGADYRQTTPVYRTGTVDGQGNLTGNLILFGQGDLTFGGRRIDANTIQITNFDHGDADNLGTALLTPQDPLYGLDQLAAQVKAAGITKVTGDVAVDDRFFEPYRVPNQDLLITPVMVNENMVDVTVTPTQPGQPATVVYRPMSAAFAVANKIITGPPGSADTVELSDKSITCLGQSGCENTISGSIPQDYKAPLTGAAQMVRTFRIEDPTTFARTAFIEALQRQGVTVTAAPVGPNPRAVLPTSPTYTNATQVAAFTSVPYSEHAKLILHVSMNLGANLSLSLSGQAKDRNTIQGSLANERDVLTTQYGVKGDQFDFPTNGSGSPDSQATPEAFLQMLTKMADSPVADAYKAALPVLGVAGSMATTSVDLPARGHVFTKPGSTVLPEAGGKTAAVKAQNLAGYIDAKSGRKLAYVVMVNNAGSIDLAHLATGITNIFSDEGTISNYLYEHL
jgi:PBP4 family serine-type D-alanyl-D-alanine carboxypeptidase